VPKRLRWHLQREPKARSAVLPILLRVIEAQLRQRIPGASARARLGAVSFVRRFGGLFANSLDSRRGLCGRSLGASAVTAGRKGALESSTPE